MVAATKPPRTLAAAFSGWPSDAAATASGSSAPAAAGGRGGQGGRRPESPRHRNLRAHGHGEAVVPQDLGHDHARARCDASPDRSAPSPVLRTRARGGLHLDLHVAVKGDGEHIESRPEVR